MQNPYNVEKLDLFYQTEADDNYHIFLKKEPYLASGINFRYTVTIITEKIYLR